ncbi:Subtilisin-like serine protease [Orchesella cincta]|uniref:Subtilisin-like serine protease n=1 Tax=Orchesella cincta TaxID=48709 RepID=A0A1D2MAS9_ORCCI|nr:Subtilisin-like serine protease [Orchesella cincta]
MDGLTPAPAHLHPPTTMVRHGTHTTGTIAGGKACYQSDLLACGDFFACPTRADGSSPDCSKAPMSFPTPGEVAEEIPGTMESLKDGMPLKSSHFFPTETRDQLLLSRPTTDGRMKPEVSAPGSNVISAYHTSDTAYVSLSGTSMACPHALEPLLFLQVRDKNLSYVKAKEFLLGEADKNLVSSGRTCEGIPDNVFPNHVFGTGRINALKSVRAQTLAMQG